MGVLSLTIVQRANAHCLTRPGSRQAAPKRQMFRMVGGNDLHNECPLVWLSWI